MRKISLKTLLVGAAVGLPLSVSATPATFDKSSAFDVQVGGYFKFYGGMKTPIQKTESQRDYALDFLSDAEVDFMVEGESHGWKYGAIVELLANPGETLSLDDDFSAARALKHKKSMINADETFMYLDSDRFGRFEMGNTDGAADKMAYYAPSGFASGGIDGIYGDFGPSLPSSFVVADFKARDTDDALKVSYYTPRWNSLQLGVSYAPNPAREGRRVDLTRHLSRSTDNLLLDGNGGVLGLSAADCLSNSEHKHALETSINFVHDFDDVSLALSGAWTMAVPRKRNGIFFQDWHSLSAGLNIGYKGFTVGGSFVWDGQSCYYRKGLSAVPAQILEDGPTTIPANAASSADAYAFSVGAQYEYKDFVFGINYYYGQSAGNTLLTGKNQKHVLAFGTTYHLLPGVEVHSEVVYQDCKAKGALAGNTAFLVASEAFRSQVKRNNFRQDAWIAMSGVKITF